MAVFSLEKGSFYLFSKREEVSVRRPDILHLWLVSCQLAFAVVDLGKALAVLHDKEREPEAADWYLTSRCCKLAPLRILSWESISSSCQGVEGFFLFSGVISIYIIYRCVLIFQSFLVDRVYLRSTLELFRFFSQVWDSDSALTCYDSFRRSHRSLRLRLVCSSPSHDGSPRFVRFQKLPVGLGGVLLSQVLPETLQMLVAKSWGYFHIKMRVQRWCNLCRMIPRWVTTAQVAHYNTFVERLRLKQSTTGEWEWWSLCK